MKLVVSTGEMRAAISATIIVIYIVVIALSAGGKFSNSDSLIESFSGVVITVIGFYFGSKGAIELLDKWKEVKTAEQKKA